MAHTPLPDTAQLDPTIRALLCLNAADAALNDASIAIRCALLPDVLPATPARDQLAGLDGLLRQFHTTHAIINNVVDQLQFAVELAAPPGSEEPPE